MSDVRCAVVTGACGGVGSAIAGRLVTQGLDGWLTDVLESVAGYGASGGRHIEVVRADMAVNEDVADLAKTHARFSLDSVCS